MGETLIRVLGPQPEQRPPNEKRTRTDNQALQVPGSERPRGTFEKTHPTPATFRREVRLFRSEPFCKGDGRASFEAGPLPALLIRLSVNPMMP